MPNRFNQSSTVPDISMAPRLAHGIQLFNNREFFECHEVWEAEWTPETGPRRWYGGAVGGLTLSGDVNTGITIRTVHLEGGIAHYRAGSTLVWDSVGAEEDAETRTKATTLFRIIAEGRPQELRRASVPDTWSCLPR